MEEEKVSSRDQKSTYSILKDAILLPPRILLSRPFLRAYLTIFLACLAGTVLLLISAVTYVLFYNTYIPHPGFEKQIYLEFPQDTITSSGAVYGEQHPYPWGFISIDSSSGPTLHASQQYDVAVTLHLPRSSTNRAAGNFMVDLQLLAPLDSKTAATFPDDQTNTASSLVVQQQHHGKVLAHTRRPGTLMYRSLVVETAQKAMVLPLYLLGWREEAETVAIPMMESIEFTRGWRNIPRGVRVVLESRERLQVYTVKVEFVAKLRGLRYVMRTYWIASFTIFTFLFWGTSMSIALTVWAGTAIIFRLSASSKKDSIKVIKEDHDADLNTDSYPKEAPETIKAETGGGDVTIKKEAQEDADMLSDNSRILRYGSSRTIKHKEHDEDDPFDEPQSSSSTLQPGRYSSRPAAAKDARQYQQIPLTSPTLEAAAAAAEQQERRYADDDEDADIDEDEDADFVVESDVRLQPGSMTIAPGRSGSFTSSGLPSPTVGSSASRLWGGGGGGDSGLGTSIDSGSTVGRIGVRKRKSGGLAYAEDEFEGGDDDGYA